MSSPLDRMARRAAADPFFLAAALDRHARSERLDDAALAARLGCDMPTLTMLRLCRMPRPEAPHFGNDIDAIAGRFGVAADVLAAAVRRGQVLLRQQAGESGAAGLLLAARDGAEEEPGDDAGGEP